MDKKILFCLLWGVVGSAGACGSSHPGNGGTGGGVVVGDGGALADPLVSKNSDLVFDDTRLWRFDLTANEADVTWLNSHIALEQSIPVTVSADGMDLGQVGFHYKGNVGTLNNCLDANGQPTCRKLGRKIEFDAYDPAKRFYGLKKLNLNSSVWDDSLMHERLGYSLFREMGVYTARATHALLYLNGEFLGVFSMIEQIDGRFTDNRFPGAGDGNLYKECWPTKSDAAYYTSCLKTNDAAPDVSGMLAFGTAVSSATDATLPGIIAQYNDVDYLMRYLAVDRGIHADDGIMTFYGGSNHNYYWYESEDRSHLWLIPWDMYSTFWPSTPLQNAPAWDQNPGDCTARYPSYSPDWPLMAPGCDKLIHGLSLIDRSRYIAAVKQFLDGPFQLDAMNAKIDRWSAQIADAVAADTHGPGLATWQSAGSVLRANLVQLRQFMENVRDGKSTVPMSLAVPGPNDFESVDAGSFGLGTDGMSNGTTTLKYGLNQTSPIGGSQDARIDFEFRDQPSQSYQQWLFVNLHIAAAQADLVKAGVTAIRFKAKADSNRTLRVDIESPANPETNKGVCIGWDVNLTTTAQEYTVTLDTGAIPSWRLSQSPTPPTTDRTAVYKNASGLKLRALPKGVGTSGFFPAGVTDPGWVEIDDISFVTQ